MTKHDLFFIFIKTTLHLNNRWDVRWAAFCNLSMQSVGCSLPSVATKPNLPFFYSFCSLRKLSWIMNYCKIHLLLKSIYYYWILSTFQVETWCFDYAWFLLQLEAVISKFKNLLFCWNTFMTKRRKTPDKENGC